MVASKIIFDTLVYIAGQGYNQKSRRIEKLGSFITNYIGLVYMYKFDYLIILLLLIYKDTFYGANGRVPNVKKIITNIFL